MSQPPPPPLVTGPVHSCAISTPRISYSPAASPAHLTSRTHCHLCPIRDSFSPESSEAFEGEVPCPRIQLHRNNDYSLRSDKKIYIFATLAYVAVDGLFSTSDNLNSSM